MQVLVFLLTKNLIRVYYHHHYYYYHNYYYNYYYSSYYIKGVVISLYPGHYIPPKPVTSLSLDGNPHPIIDSIINHNIDDDSILEVNAYSIHCCYYGGNIDANYGQSSSISLAHLVNHPPLKQKPNVINYEFCWNDLYNNNDDNNNVIIKQNINRIGYKDVWYIDPITNETISLNPKTYHHHHHSNNIIGMCYITTNTIEQDEEIFFDYKYEPDVANKLKWYHKV